MLDKCSLRGVSYIGCDISHKSSDGRSCGSDGVRAGGVLSYDGSLISPRHSLGKLLGRGGI